MDAVAVDFETANEAKSSACSIGLAWLKSGSIVCAESFLIKPPEEKFSHFNKKIHGIKSFDVINAEKFDDIWLKIFGKDEIPLILCHNADFDIKVILECFNHYSMDWREIQYICTLELSRILWPDQDSYKLNAISALVGLNLRHHDAQSDALASAQIAIEAIKETDSSDIFEALKKLKITPKIIRNVNFIKNDEPIDLTGKSFALTGGLIYVTRNNAISLIKTSNGIVHNALNKKTDFFVVGSKPANSKLLLAQSLKDAGACFKIIDENEFLEMLDFRR